MSFVKSATTSTSSTNSRSQMDKLLKRYGASQVSYSEDTQKRLIVVSFVIPDSLKKDAQRVPVKLPVSVFAVYDALYGRPSRWREFRVAYDAQSYNPKKLDQAERVAWRNLVLWIDAALSAASVGIQTVTEAFFAHAVVGDRGERMIEVVASAQASLGAGTQRLLTSEVPIE